MKLLLITTLISLVLIVKSDGNSLQDEFGRKYSEMDIDELIDIASSREGMEWLKDKEQLELMGIDPRLDPDIILDSFLLVPALIARRGYPVENHTVMTDDGYFLEMHRIPGSPKSPPAPGKRPIFLMHGLLDASSTWVIMGPEKGLGYLLADLGYDVWMGNARGNRYSRKHITNDPDGWRGNRRKFWAFSWHQIGSIDVPNMIDYVIQQTGINRIHYVGHSQGSTAFFVMCSQRPEYNDRIISMNALGPAAFLSNLKGPFVRAAAMFLNSIDVATSFLGVYEFLPNTDILGLFGQGACNDESMFQGLCANVLFLIAGYNTKQLNRTMIPVITGHTPAGASTDQVIHFGQLVRSGYFRQYDHGAIKNLIEYGSIRPPKYNLKNIRAPVALHYSSNDWLVDSKDVFKLQRDLGNVIGAFLVPDPNFNHLDFTWAIDVKTLLYNRVFEIIKIYEQREIKLN